jgi:GNAT superfamily N-acetyltransferase
MTGAGSRTDHVQVRPAGDADHEALASLQWQWRVEEWRETPELDAAEFSQAFKRWASEHELTHEPFIATAGSRIAGMGWLAVTERVPSPARWKRLGGNLQSVYVVPSLRNRGIGAALVDAVVQRSRELGLDYVIVHPSERSFPLYRRHGFADAGRFLELRLRF